MEDHEIVSLYWARNENAVKETAAKYGKYCYAIAHNILGNAQDAEESVSDAYANAWNSIPPHRPAILQTFLAKITRYVCLKKWRASKAAKRGGGDTAYAFEELLECIPDKKSIDSELDNKALAAVLDAFLTTLPTMERRVFVCRYWYLDSILSISNQFGYSESKVKSMLYRTRKKLLIKLESEGVFI